MPRRKNGRRVSCGNAGAVESVESQKQAFPSFHEPLGNLAQRRRDPHISTTPAARAVGKWKTKSRFPTFPPPRMYMEIKNKNRAAGGLRTPPGGGRFAPPKSQKVIVVDREK
jgi:hypothetical protein